MTSKERRLSGLKYQLRQKRENREKEVIWKLSNEQKEYVERLGYTVIPWIYEINTKSITGIRGITDPMIKDVHYAGKRGQKKLYRKLRRRDLKTLEEYDIRYYPFKYKVILQ